MQFSPLGLENLIIEPLRYYFSNYTEKYGLVWNPDEKLRNMDISASNDFHKTPLQEKPRILVDRGSYVTNKTAISDSMSSQKTLKQSLGIPDREVFYLVQGEAIITVEARQKGACEVLTELTARFVAWTRPFICDVGMFKEFALPMQVSPCTLGSPEGETEMFTTTISIPYIKEDRFRTYTDGVKFKTFVMNMMVGETNYEIYDGPVEPESSVTITV